MLQRDMKNSRLPDASFQRWNFSWKKKNVDIYSRHDGRDGEELGHQIGQVAVHEYEEGLDLPDPGGEPRGEGGHEAEQDAETHPSEPDHEEPRHPQEHIHRLHYRHLRHEVEHVVQHLKNKAGKLTHADTHSAALHARMCTYTPVWEVMGGVRGCGL